MNNYNSMNKIVLAITGASGSIYARQIIEKLLEHKTQWEELAVVMSENAKIVWETELGDKQYDKYPVKYYALNDFNAPFASGSAGFNTMIIAPCSMGTLGRIANGLSHDLIGRAADVILKERRKLICVVRETPFNLIHIKNMELIMLAGGIICPAIPSFYSKPKTIEELTATVTNRVIDLAGIQHKAYRWGSED